MDREVKKSPLADLYPEKTKLMEFAGWQMPRDAGSIIAEHNAVRKNAGVFDLSHMGRIVIKGPEADRKLSRLFTRDLSAASKGRALYGFICEETGYSLDDDIFYKRSPEEIWGVVNAANCAKVYNWLTENLPGLEVLNLSEETVLLAIQGPKAPYVFERIGLELPKKMFRASWNEAGMLATTGYSGEAGGEIWLKINEGREVFEKLLQEKITFCGLGARDSLRLEKGYPLHGHELNDEIDPLAAGLDFFIDWKHDFKGRKILLERKNKGLKRKIRGLLFNTRRSPRLKAKLIDDTGKKAGYITSSGYSPTLNHAIALALLDSRLSLNQRVKVKSPTTSQPAKITNLPFL
ncbi:MAG: glycine cleavage system aminomethyltransferase GcvT [bacterium]